MKPAIDQKSAKKRLRHFFERPGNERRDIFVVMEALSKCADVYIFGGAVRDISLLGSPKFESDIDIVLEVYDSDHYRDLLDIFGAQRNKFGGYRLRIGRWNFDVWETKKTWAFSSGHLNHKGPFSMLDTTFFNWDAILYDVKAGSLHHRYDYFSNLSNQYLEMNFEKNPNEIGALVRTLRTICLSDEIQTGPRLTRFVQENFAKTEDQFVRDYESKSFSSIRLSARILEDFRFRLSEWNGNDPVRWFEDRQPTLFTALHS